MHGDIWQLQEAKARFSEVVRAVKRRKKPQVITVHGKKEVMVVPYREDGKIKRARKKKKYRTVGEFLKDSLPENLRLSDEEAEDLFGRDRTTRARGTDEPLFD